jgi:hypothetical protein
MWKDKLQEIIQEKKIYGEKVNIGATEDEIEIFFKEAVWLRLQAHRSCQAASATVFFHVLPV